MSQGSGSGYGGGDYNSGGYTPSNNQSYNQSQGLGGTLTVIMVFGVIWAVWSFLFGIACIAIMDEFLYYGGGLALTGGLSIVSGLLAILCCVFIYQQKNHMMACILCLIGSLIGLYTGLIFCGVIGIVFFILMLTKEKNRFSS